MKTVEIQGRKYRMMPISGGKGFTLQDLTGNSAFSNAFRLCDHVMESVPVNNQATDGPSKARCIKCGYDTSDNWRGIGEWVKDIPKRYVNEPSPSQTKCDHRYVGYTHDGKTTNIPCHKCGHVPCPPYEEDKAFWPKEGVIDNSREGNPFQRAPTPPFGDASKCEFNVDKLMRQLNLGGLTFDLEILKKDIKQRIRNLAEKHGISEEDAMAVYNLIP